jgi:hypothetical protein
MVTGNPRKSPKFPQEKLEAALDLLSGLLKAQIIPFFDRYLQPL